MSEQVKYTLDESQMPKSWYNIVADLPTPPPTVLHPGTQAADRSLRSRTAVSDGADPPGGFDRAADRHSRTRARHFPHVAAVAADPRAQARKEARHAGKNLFQIRGRVARRLAQAQYRRASGLVQQAGRHQEALDRDGRRPVGLFARLRRFAVRHRRDRVSGPRAPTTRNPIAAP